MSTLSPIVFPEDPRGSSRVASAFPYTSIDEVAVNQLGQNKHTNRMKQLESMLKEVQGRAEIVEKEAYDKAYLAGEKAGMVLGRKRGEQILESLQHTLQEAETSLANIQQSFAEAAMDVAKHVAENIVGDLTATDTAKLLDIARQATARLPDSNGLRIAVSPDDFFSFKRLFEDEHSQDKGSADKPMLILSRDTTVNSGSCRIISKQQDILIDPVAAVSTYLDTLRPVLLSPAQHDAKPASSDPLESEPLESDPL